MEILTVSLTDARYPPLLRESAQPPHFLYVRGNVDLLRHPMPFAVVGTRGITPYGHVAVRRIVEPAAKAGICIVSGLALGTDAACHEAALRVGGSTIAVLAGGTDPASVTPRSNANLAERIVAAGGLLISEHPPGSPSYKGGFIERNRIIAGMCKGTLVIEAAGKSGALSTAYRALDDNRDVFAVPGPITASSSDGCNHLLQRGAHVTIDAQELFTLFRIDPARAAANAAASATRAARTDAEKAVLAALAKGPADADELIARTALDARAVTVALTALRIADAVAERAGTYLRN